MNKYQTRQLSLQLHLNPAATFNNYLAGTNQTCIDILKNSLINQNETSQNFYLWSTETTGRTHLLQACCQLANHYHLSAIYIPLSSVLNYDIGYLDGLEEMNLICIDDIHHAHLSREWQEGLFHLYNRSLHSGARWIVSADMPPQQLEFNLADLKSRLMASIVFQLEPLNDEQKLQWLYMQSEMIGLEINADTARFLLARCERSMQHLSEIVTILDEASISEQRKLTVPFVKKILNL